MVFKMKGHELPGPNQKKKKGKDPYTKKDYDFLKEQKEERVTSMDYLSKTPRGPVETKNKPSRKEIEDSFKIGETIEKLQDDAMDSPGAYIKSKMKKR